MKKIYLACPYSHELARVRKLRVYYANIAAGWLMKQGHLVYSPLSHSDPIADLMADVDNCDHDFWLKQCMSMLVDWADEVHVLKLSGWDKSKGVLLEMDKAVELEKPVVFISAFLK